MMYGFGDSWGDWGGNNMMRGFGFGGPTGMYFAGFGLIMLWSLIWKGLALYKAARRGEHWWFLGLMLVNTAGILDILYLYVFTKGGPDLTHGGPTKSSATETPKA